MRREEFIELMAVVKLFDKVHCHVCPLKDKCDVGDHEKSYQYHNRYDYGGGHFHSDMTLVTQNCPLKKLVEKEISE